MSAIRSMKCTMMMSWPWCSIMLMF